jgi:large repetitive protein
MERIDKNPKDYRKCDLLMRKIQPMMKKLFHKNSQLPFPLILREAGITAQSSGKHRITTILNFIVALLICLPIVSNAALTLPAIPSNSSLAKKFELSTEMVFRVKVGETYLPSGALIAYINGEIRGAQTASVNFPGTGVNVYKVLVFNDKSGDEISFKYYDIFSEKIYDIQEKIEFVYDLVPDYSNPQILNAFCKPIEQVTGLLPENGKENLNATLDLFWQPSPNTTYYKLYVWEDGTATPSTPLYSNVYNTSARVYNLKYGQLYRWKVGSVNDCSSVESIVQTFRIRQLPDLTVDEIIAPPAAVSGTDFALSFKIKNTGIGYTAGAQWYDALFVSTDATLSNDDKLLSNTINSKQLETDSSYTKSLTVSLPVEYSGNYFFIVKTDYYNSVAEISETNNEKTTSSATAVTLKTLPDILVKNIQAEKVNVNPGDSLIVNWQVENSGGTTAIGGWSERISIVPVSGTKITISPNTEYRDSLTSGSTVNRTRKIKIPDIPKFSGSATIEVELIPFPQLLEYAANKANNKSESANQIILAELLNLNILTTSVVENTPFPVRCIVSRSGEFSSALVVTLSASVAGQVIIPATVTFPAGQSSVAFDLSTINNTTLEGPRTISITASASNFNNSVKEITITDDEKPSLSAYFSNNKPTEGETIDLVVKRDLVTNQPLSVSIAANKPNQWTFTSPVIIPANKDSVKIAVNITDDKIPELNADAIMYVSAAGVNPVQVTASIVDNDIPQVTFEILSDTVSESGGVYATWGLITRVKGDESITVNLTQSPAGALFFPSTITLAKGVGSQKFNIGVVDNGEVDGFRNITVTGSIYISSCNCGTTPENGGIVSDNLVIADNDGPSLSISVFPLSLMEGKQNAGTITISRNTPPDVALEITITNNDPTEVEIQTTATIPAGEKSVQVPIHTINDNVEDGNQMVLVQAAATGFNSGFGYVFVTDLNKPDLEITDLQLNTDTAATNELIEITGSALNSGYATAPTGVKIKFYRSNDTNIDANDKLLGEYVFTTTILQGAAADFIAVFDIPDETGKFYILAKINPDQTLTELAYFNNDSEPVNLIVTPEYQAVAIADSSVYTPTTPITLRGSAFKNNNDKVPNADVDVYILTNGTRRELKVKTDESGDFTVLFNPNSNESGHYSVGACFPGQKLNDEQDEFDIPGIARISSANIIWDMKLGQTLTGKIAIRNTSEATLNYVTIIPENLPAGCELTFDTIVSLAGNETKEFSFILKATELTVGKDYEKIDFTVSSAENATLKFPAYYYCQALQAKLKIDPVSLNTTMTKGKSRIYTLSLYNNGAGESGTVTISLPKVDWMTLLSPSVYDNIASQDTVQVLISLEPTDETPLNTPISGGIAINCVNGDGVLLPYRIEAVSEETGGLRVDVIDEYTYYTEEKPHVKNARVVVRHPFSGKVVAEGFTGTDGIFFVENLPEGAYRMTVEAEKHDGFQTTIIIDPGRTNEQTVFLSFQAISYSWEVVPTEIEDQYEIQLIMKFETNVPVPVVIMEMPTNMPQLYNDETFPFLITLTNKGLITANDVQLNLPQNDPEYVFLTNFTKLDLLAQQAIQVPVVMKRRDALKSANALEGLDATQSTGPCTDYAFTIYGWQCGKDGNWAQTSHGITFTGRVCAGTGGGIFDGWPGGPSGGGGPYRGGGDGRRYDPGNNTPTISAPTVGCSNCAIDLLLALGGCLPTAGPVFNTMGCVKTLVSYDNPDGDPWVTAEFVFDMGICLGGYIPVAGCPIGLVGAAKSCFKEFFLKNAAILAALQGNETIPPIIRQALLDMTYFIDMHDALVGGMNEFMGGESWRDKNSFQDFLAELKAVSEPNTPITPDKVLLLKQKMAGSDVTSEDIDMFVTRWNNTIEAYLIGIYSPTQQYPNIINNAFLEEMVEKQDAAEAYAFSKGFATVGELFNDALKTIKEEIEDERSSVCASVTINITQKLVMTREAFEGTLTIYNGNKTTAMEEILLNLEIKDENGVLSNDLFHIETKALSILTGIDGTGALGADQKGSATVLFIPEKGAAPTVPKSYSFGGSFSYIDPFTGIKVTKPLIPVTLDVNPSPDLYLHYFMQRDILGDDALTLDVVEPIVPAELAVMIQNDGYGTAKNVRIESAQPKIVENEKGLAINFALIGSNLNGQPMQLGLTNISFGNIPPKTNAIGQWWFTSDLLGHFVSYETKLTHLDSRGNPDLSLVSGVSLHELIKSVRVYSMEDNINDFLVNEVQDSKETPDIIYLSNGGTLDVYPAVSHSVSGSISTGNHEIELLVTPKQMGWNYYKFDDPGNGVYKIESVTRDDGQIIPIENVWQTHVTLPDGKEPVYENKIHFLDVFSSSATQKYIIRFIAPPQNPPYIVRFENVPATFVTQPVTSIDVVFNKPIDPATFSFEDMTLRVQGGADIMDATVTVSEINQTTFRIDLTSKSTLDGYYALNVQTTGIKDLVGTSGVEGLQANWTQFVGIPAVSEFIGLPNNNVGPPFDLLLVRFNVAIDKTTLLPARFSLQKNGSPISASITVTEMDTEGKLFQLSGLQSSMAEDGSYSLTVDLPNIKSLDGNNGMQAQSAAWKIDQTSPGVSEILSSNDGGYDSQHRTSFTVKFNEPVNGVIVNSLELWKDGQRQPNSQLNLSKVSDSEYLFTQFRLLTYYEGTYQLKVKLKDIVDVAGNSGTDTFTFEWIVNRAAPVAVTGLRIAPDLGYLNTDAITSTKNLVAHMTVNQARTRIQIYQTVGGNAILLADTTDVDAGQLLLPVTLSFTGNLTLEAHCIDIFGNVSITKLPMFIDEAALTGSWINVPLLTATNQISMLQVEFSDKLLDDSKLKDNLKFERNGQVIGNQNLTVTKSGEKLYTVSGMDLSGNVTAIYSMTINLINLEKYSSGKQGATSPKVQWTVQTINRAPNANAGSNQIVGENTIVTLNGSGSNDPDGDELTYLWTAPSGITLSSETVANPTFTAPEVNSNQVLTFSLTVNDGKMNSTVSNMTVTVKNTSGLISHSINLTTGWNIFSTNLLPEEMDLAVLFQSLIDDGSLEKVQDEKGKSLLDYGIFGGWTNNIGNYTEGKGYKVKVKKESQLNVLGTPSIIPFKIPLEPGWNIIGYPHSSPANAQLVVQQLIDKGVLIKVQDEKGNSIEDWGILGGWTNNIGNFMPGEGYKIKMRLKDTLIIFESYIKSALASKTEKIPTVHFLPAFEGNGVDHMNINMAALPSGILQSGDEFAVFDGGICVGAVKLMPQHLRGQPVSIAASATDNQGMAGFNEGNPIILKLWDSQSNQEFVLEPLILKGTSTFTKHETTVVSLEKYISTGFKETPGAILPEIKVYPNPFSDEVTIEINLAKDAEVDVEMTNQQGQHVKMIATKKQLISGVHRFTWNGRNASNREVSQGIYHLLIEIDNTITHRKIVLSK